MLIPLHLVSSIYIKECVLSVTKSLSHSLTQHGPGDSTEDSVTNFGVQICFEVLTSTKAGLCEIPPLSSPPGGKRHVFEYNSTSNYPTMTKLLIGTLDFNIKKSILVILEFSILRGYKGKTLNSALNYFTLKKFYMRRLGMNAKKIFR